MIGSISFCTGLASAKTLVAAVFFRTFFNEAVAGRLYTPARLYYSFFGLLPRMKRSILRGIMRPIVFFPLLLVLATLAGFGSAARPAPERPGRECVFVRVRAFSAGQHGADIAQRPGRAEPRGDQHAVRPARRTSARGGRGVHGVPPGGQAAGVCAGGEFRCERPERGARL